MDKIKVSDIRAQFPMYADLSDDDLLIGLRKKFYSDIPLKQFLSRIDYDTDRAKYNPTEGMSGLQKFAAGYGKAGVDLARGAGQWLGLVSRDDVAESRRLDEALMNTTAGTAGNISGNIAAVLPTAFIPGANTLTGAAATGAVTGALAPSVSTEETLKNIGIGAALGPVSTLAGRGVAAGVQGVKGLVDPLTKAGQGRVAASALQSFATDPAKAAASIRASKPLVPGSRPTLAQASRDPGLAQFERTLVNNPETGGELAARFAEQRAARLQAVKNVAGTDDYYEGIKEGRRIFANEDYGRAMKAGINTDMAKAMQPQIESLMRRPSMKEAQAVAKRIAAESDIDLSDFGSIEGLDWLKKALDTQISAVKTGNPIGRADLKTLMQTKNDLMSVIENIAPAYKEANANFAAMSKQVNAMDVARDLQKKYQPALARFGASTKEHADAYATALESAIASTKKSTGVDLPLSKFMPEGEIRALENVASDLAQKVSAENLGRAAGSNTAQNIAAQNLLRRTLGPTGLPQSWAESTALQTMLAPVTGLYKLGGADKRIMDRLVGAALEPDEAVGLLTLAQQQGLLEKLGKRGEKYIPVPALAGLLSVSPNE